MHARPTPRVSWFVRKDQSLSALLAAAVSRIIGENCHANTRRSTRRNAIHRRVYRRRLAGDHPGSDRRYSQSYAASPRLVSAGSVTAVYNVDWQQLPHCERQVVLGRHSGQHVRTDTDLGVHTTPRRVIQTGGEMPPGLLVVRNADPVRQSPRHVREW